MFLSGYILQRAVHYSISRLFLEKHKKFRSVINLNINAKILTVQYKMKAGRRRRVEVEEIKGNGWVLNPLRDWELKRYCLKLIGQETEV